MRPEERRPKRRTLHVDSQPTVRTEVNARPVTNFTAPRVQENKLLQVLNAVNPALERFTKEANEDSLAQGRQAAIDEVSIEEANNKIKSGEWLKEQSPYFQVGYMNYLGQRTARESSRDLMQSYENDFNPDTDDIDEFLSQYTAQDLAGNQDGDFLNGYSPIMDAAKSKLRGEYISFQTEMINAEVDDGIFQNLEAAYLAATEAGDGTISPADFAALKADAVDFFGKTGKEFEEIAFSVINKHAMEGFPEAYNIFFEKRADGTPGMGHTKRWGEKIKQAQLRATSASLSKLRATSKAEEDREKDLQQKIESVLMQRIIEGDPSAGQLINQFNSSLKPGSVRSLHQFNHSYKNNAASIIQDPGVYGAILSGVASGELTEQDLNNEFNHSVKRGRGLTTEDYTRLMNMQRSIQKSKSSSVGSSGAVKANLNFLLGQYRVDSTLVLPTESVKINKSLASARLHYDQLVTSHFAKNPDVDLSDPDTHKKFNEYANEAIKMYPPPQDIFSKFSQENIPAQYRGSGGRARLADDFDAGRIPPEEFNELFSKTLP